MLDDDAMKNTYIASMNKCLNKTKYHRNYADKAKLKQGTKQKLTKTLSLKCKQVKT